MHVLFLCYDFLRIVIICIESHVMERDSIYSINISIIILCSYLIKNETLFEENIYLIFRNHCNHSLDTMKKGTDIRTKQQTNIHTHTK